MKEARSGLYTEKRSLNGSGRRVRCFGFMVNVRHPLPPYIPMFLMWYGLYSRIWKEHYIVCDIPYLAYGLMTF